MWPNGLYCLRTDEWVTERAWLTMAVSALLGEQFKHKKRRRLRYFRRVLGSFYAKVDDSVARGIVIRSPADGADAQQ